MFCQITVLLPYSMVPIISGCSIAPFLQSFEQDASTTM
jgi:hypothetical protein